MVKYPYIKDKSMYSAVLSVCRRIKEGGDTHRAVMQCARAYNVDADKLREQVRLRQQAERSGPRSGEMSQFHFKGYFKLYKDELLVSEGEIDLKVPAVSLYDAWSHLDERVLRRKIDPFREEVVYQLEIQGQRE